MGDTTMIAVEPMRQDALATTLASLRRTAGYELPPELDLRLLGLMERKETLAAEEKAELSAWIGFTQERTLDKLGAEVALHRLKCAFPELVEEQ
jgi:hypothetical protein